MNATKNIYVVKKWNIQRYKTFKKIYSTLFLDILQFLL